MFADLLKIKKLREDTAKSAVREAERAVEAAKQAVVEAEQAAADYHEERLRAEDRLFDEIRGAEVRLADIDRMKDTVAAMRSEELRLVEEIEAKKRAVPEARERVAEAEAAHAEAQKATEKFKEFVDIQKAEEAKIAAFKEEAEAEEITEAIFAVRTRGIG